MFSQFLESGFCRSHHVGIVLKTFPPLLRRLLIASDEQFASDTYSIPLRGPDITAGRGQLEICAPIARLTADLRGLILATMLPYPVGLHTCFYPRVGRSSLLIIFAEQLQQREQ